MDWFLVKFVSAILFLAAFVVFFVWMIVDHENWLEEQQNKQDKCIAAGGAWIDNRTTEGYCFFNK